jgi:hypothetical protein
LTVLDTTPPLLGLRHLGLRSLIRVSTPRVRVWEVFRFDRTGYYLPRGRSQHKSALQQCLKSDTRCSLHGLRMLALANGQSPSESDGGGVSDGDDDEDNPEFSNSSSDSSSENSSSSSSDSSSECSSSSNDASDDADDDEEEEAKRAEKGKKKKKKKKKKKEHSKRESENNERVQARGEYRPSARGPSQTGLEENRLLRSVRKEPHTVDRRRWL